MPRYLAFLVVCLASVPPAFAQAVPEFEGARLRHRWARHGVGSWQQVRVLIERFDSGGNLESTTTRETKSTLIDVNDSSYTLKVDVVVEVAGRKFEAEPKEITQGFLGESADQVVGTSLLGDGEIVIGRSRFPCKIQQVVIQGSGTRKTIRTSYSLDIAPYVLRREIRSTNAEGKNLVYEALVEVLAVDMPYKVLTQIKPSAFVRTVNRQSNGTTTTTIEVHCPQVPGAVVAHSSQELDSAGRLVGRSTLELTDYESFRPVQRNAPPTNDGRRAEIRRLPQ